MELIMNLAIFAALVAVGFVSGTIAEKRHYRSIEKRERASGGLPAVTMQRVLDESLPVRKTYLAYGSVVVSLDYFKRILAALRNIVGGEVASYETLLDRGRREAVLRMKEMAPGADAVLNVRIETSVIGQSANRRNSVGSIEVLAYGTAVYLDRDR